MPTCLIPGCSNEGENNISIRLRRPDTSAIWAPNTEAFLCSIHSGQGYVIKVEMRPAATLTTTTEVSAGGRVETRTTSINNTP
jgi:hypothetical protein